MSRKLILVRHSLPEIKKDRPAREWKLSEEGRARAARLAGRLICYQPELLVTSPEPKALETAEIIAGRLHLTVQVIEDLHEHERSQVSYHTRPEFDTSVHEFFTKPHDLVFGSETAHETYERFCQAVHSVLSLNQQSIPLIVSHGTVMSLYASRLTGLPAFEIWSKLGLPGFIILDMESKSMLSFENIL
jgi:broad specificity phosphatase PhoE